MHKIFCALGFAAVSFLGLKAQTKIMREELQPLMGNWQGSLTYLDYTSGKPYSMPANVEIKQIGRSNQLLWTLQYPDEPEANSTDTIALSEDGTQFDGEPIQEIRHDEDGTTRITTMINGVDGNDDRPALLRHTYTMNNDSLTIRKDVQFVGENNWIERHEYSFGKQIPVSKPKGKASHAKHTHRKLRSKK
jgi:hypothetical protein